MLAYLLDRLDRVKTSLPVIVATSRDTSDDPIVDYCTDRGTPYLRGALEDVAERFIEVLNATNAKAFVRTNGDSPLLDPALIDQGVKLFYKTGADLATNVKRRTYPKGMSVEVVDALAFRRAHSTTENNIAVREHVTSPFYINSNAWDIAAFEHSPELGHLNFSVNTSADFASFETTIARMSKPHWSYGMEEIVKLHGAYKTP